MRFDACHGSGVVRLRRPPPPATRTRKEARIERLTARGPKKLVLAYPEYSSITAAPLGVAYLKSMVQKSLPDWSAKILDLNLESHEHFLAELRQGPFFTAKELPEGREGELAIVRAAETYRGAHEHDFFDADRMIDYARLWNRAMKSVLFMPNAYSRALFQGGPRPDRISRHVALILKEKPTAVGISICYIEQYFAGLCLAKAIRERAPDVVVLLGGTMFKEGIAREWGPKAWPADYIVSGAGELPIVEILAGRAEEANVAGVTIVEGEELRTTPPFYDTDFEALPDADFSDFDLRAYFSPRPVVAMQTTRGCYWKRCTFCNHYTTVGGSYQLRSIPRLVDEMRRHVANGVRHFTFVDDIISPARFNAMGKAILDAGLSIRYHAMSRPMRHFTDDIFKRMFDSGCRFVLWGVESGSQRVLDLMEKGTVVADVEGCLARAAAAGIKNHVFIICGFPTETREEFQETLAFLERVRPHVHAVHKGPFGLERGTPVYDHPERFDITRMWRKPTPLIYDYECRRGMSPADARAALDEARPFFRSFAAGKALEKGDFRFRDHMLLFYCRDEWERLTDRRATPAGSAAGTRSTTARPT